MSNRTGFWFSNSSYVYEDVPKIDSKANDLRKTLQKTLNDIGVNYTHRNEFLIAESTIEGRRVQTMLEVSHVSTLPLVIVSTFIRKRRR